MSTNLHPMNPNPDIVHIEYTNREDGYSDDLDNKIYLLKNVNIYADPGLSTVLRIEPKGTMIAFDREVIRGGKRLLRIIEQNGSYTYTPKDLNAVRICTQCMVKESRTLEFVMIPHDEFDQCYLPLPLSTKVIEDGHEAEFETNIRREGDFSIYTVKDSFIDDKDNFISTLSFLSLKTNGKDYKIGRLEDYSKFYISSYTGSGKPSKILTAEGTEGIFFSPRNIYTLIGTPLDKFIDTLSLVIAVLIIIALVVVILAVSGWIVYIGLIMIPVGFFISLIITAPLRWIIKYVYKFL